MIFTRSLSQCTPDRIRGRAKSALSKLITIQKQHAADPELYAGLNELISLLQIQNDSLTHLERTDERELQLLSSCLESLDDNIAHAQKKILEKKRRWFSFTSKKGKEKESVEEPLKGPLIGIAKAIDQLQHITKSDNIGAQPLLDASSLGEDDRQELHRQEEWKTELQNARDLPSASRILWKALPSPEWPGFTARGMVSEHPDDGLIYPLAKIKDAESIANSFHSGWNTSFKASSHTTEISVDKAAALRNMADICLVLKTMDQGELLLRRFCEYRITQCHDLTLPLQQDILSQILPVTLAPKSRLFEAEQHRVVRRDYASEWDRTKQPVKLAMGEPMPYLPFRDCPGSFANVSILRHVDDKQRLCAIKVAREARFSNQIRSEMDILKSIEPHMHVIRLVAVLERSENLMLMLEAATNDLSQQLGIYRANHHQVSENFDLEHERRMLYTAFGCLSNGLLYLHKEIRHKDIKLDNILHIRENDGSARFVFADFGIAHHYGKGNANSTNNAWNYAKQCTAPEVLEDSGDYMLHRASRLRDSRIESLGHDGSRKSHTTYQPSGNGKRQDHDIKSDIYSLGACFIAILSTIIGERPPTPEDIFSKVFIYAEHVNSIRHWAEEHEANQADPELEAAFQVARGMFQFDKDSRWNLEDVISRLSVPELRCQMFCKTRCRQNACNLAQRCSDTLRVDPIPNRRATPTILEEDFDQEAFPDLRTSTSTKISNIFDADSVSTPARTSVGKESQASNSEYDIVSPIAQEIIPLKGESNSEEASSTVLVGTVEES